jgi:16S rRNA (guanine527-N7)-methyltransferase
MDRPREPLPSRVEGLPELPADALAELDRGLALLELVDLPGDSRRILVDHLRLLAAWNEAINLTAIRDPVAAVRLHVLDSLTAVAVLRARGVDAILDLGSGAGFPGIPLAMAVPARRALLVDSVAKKARFLAAAVAGLGLAGRVEAFSGRVEELAGDRRHRERWPAVVARAVGSLAEVAEIGLPLVAPGGLLIAWKRGDLGPELGAAEPILAALGGGATNVVPTDPGLGLEGHVLVVTAKVGSSPPGYPRDPATRRRKR